MKVSSETEAVSNIRPGQRIFVHGAAATPNTLLKALCDRAQELNGCELIHLHLEGKVAHANPEVLKYFKVANFFVGPSMRPLIDHDRVDYIPIFLSEIPRLIRSGKRPIDVAMIHVSPPDQHGYCTLGTSVDVARAAVESADMVIAQVNRQMPRIHGDGFVHLDQIDKFIEIDEPLPERHCAPLTNEERAIGRNVASLIENGSTLQMGIGSIPDAVLEALKGHKHLGIHTEMWAQGALDLIKTGVVDNSKKKVHPGKTVSAFIFANKAVYDFIHDNPSIVQLETDYVNHPVVIARNPKVVAINSAVEVDLTGQVCADSVGTKIISGVGGQMDFMRGAAISTGGKPVIAITSRSKKGHSRIVSTLRPGAGVVTTRSHVHYVVTEYGIADLYGKTLSERAQALIAIAHPEDRENLTRQFKTNK
ncbi:MAG: acetyl-CoA hydrolase/transferase family protein [Oligoflexia bacterium]|nr:acetyl-CoA hydrolase/transferase family protein [Oligoflexia bacterium]